MYRHDDNINRINAQIILHLLQHCAKQMGRCQLRIWFRNVEVSDTSGDAMKYNSRLHKKNFLNGGINLCCSTAGGAGRHETRCAFSFQ